MPLPESALMSVLNSEQLDSTGDDLAAEEVDDLTTPSKAVLDFSRKDAFLEKVSDEDLEIEKLIEDSCDVIDVESLKDVSSDEVSSSNALADLEIDDLIGDATDILIEGSMNDSASPEEDSEDLEIDTLIAGVENYAMQDDEASQLMVGPDSIAAKTEEESAGLKLSEAESDPSFTGKQVSIICERLNLHNRLAKQCSFECQNLFLSLFFKDHAVTAEGVVANLRENGFVVYVPRFGIRGPVYLRDSDGHVQMDPTLLNLAEDCGSEPTVGSAGSRFCRRFQKSEAQLFLSGREKLEVVVSGQTKMSLKPLDVVHVEIFCSDWDQRARIPHPRMHLIHKSHVKHTPTENQTAPLPTSQKREVKLSTGALVDRFSLFDVIHFARNHDFDRIVEGGEMATKSLTPRSEQVRGRIVFGSFENPSTRQAAQRLAQEEAAAEAKVRRNNAIQRVARRDDVVNTRRIEREVTMRQQRLEKQKFQSRRAKRQ